MRRGAASMGLRFSYAETGDDFLHAKAQIHFTGIFGEYLLWECSHEHETGLQAEKCVHNHMKDLVGHIASAPTGQDSVDEARRAGMYPLE